MLTAGDGLKNVDNCLKLLVTHKIKAPCLTSAPTHDASGSNSCWSLEGHAIALKVRQKAVCLPVPLLMLGF